MSQEFLDHLKDHGIIAHRTPPYTLQHNGVSKKRNSTLLDMVRSMMSQTTLPKSFWDYALESAARILNMVPTKKVDKKPYKDDQEIDEPQSDINPIRRSTRTCCATDRMCLYIDAGENEVGDLGEPANYKAALLDPKSDKWLNAINVEIQSMKDKKLWELVVLPPSVKTVGHKWLLKKKTDMDGALHTYKARLVAKGFTQILTGYEFVLNGGVIDWKSTKQSIFNTSSTDAEYIAAFDASKEAVWIHKFISGLGVIPIIKEPINMYCDNT
uniref:Retrovirus-related Pol polyprotein from transposon TNT 1-94 n=1 Tax=Tanacetum cinerariifolium TaxID=118510 RepID=A0A6L2JWP8_TANCI|nr:retrovirus-related Pol polyprotein from transposon TNT 1-94 [Tanacetum cinerariifolium]